MSIKILYLTLLSIILLCYGTAYRYMFDGHTAKTSQYSQREQLRMLAIAAFGFGIPLFIAFTTPAKLKPEQLIAGSAIAATSAGLFLWVSSTLGRNYSPTLEIQENHTLIESGPYKYVRHPMYSAFLLWFVAQSILLPDIVVSAGSAIATALLLFQRIPAEEALLRSEFGIKYDAYVAKTTRVIPFIY